LLSVTKGGAGKTTIATNLAAWLVRQGSDVLPSMPTTRAAPQTYGMAKKVAIDQWLYAGPATGPNVRKQIEALRCKYDHTGLTQ
jgi:chromosome partitioning protein